jgi:hypothetical protein
MTTEGWVALIGLAGTALNVYLTLTIKLGLEKQKNWVLENFITKADLPRYLQLAESEARIIRGGHAS